MLFRTVRAVALLLLSTVAAVMLPSPVLSQSDTGGAGALPAAELSGLLAGGRTPELSGVTVQGVLDLRPVESVRRPFRCRACRFTGDVLATDVIFERIVDLSGSVFEGRVDLTAAVFRDRAGFESVTFGGDAAFSATRFAADTSFAEAEFRGPAAFDRAQFSMAAAFPDVTFRGRASFPAAQFNGNADLSGARFEAASNFNGSVFTKGASFARAAFAETAQFRGTFLLGGANLGAREYRKGFNLDGATAGGTVDFRAAVLRADGDLTNFSSTGALALERLRPLSGAHLFLDGLSVASLTMDVERISVVRGPDTQTRTLEMVEQTGRESGNLALANRARFQLLELEGQKKTGFARLVDRLLFRDVAGYLVRPLSPLVALGVAVLVAGVLRAARTFRTAAWRGDSGASSGGRMQRNLRRILVMTGGTVEKVLDGVSTSVGIALSRKAGHIKREDSNRIRDHLKAWGLWIEFFGYKALIAVFLLALGNSNSTVRQLLDAVLG